MFVFLAGLGLGLSLIVAIGAQNLFVLREGVRGGHTVAVVLVCILSDALLIAAGVAGIGALVESAPAILVAAKWGGAAFLVGFAVVAGRRAWRGTSGLDGRDDGHDRRDALDGNGGERGRTSLATRRTTSTRLRVVLTALALTWLNPHVYLDTVLLLGSVAATHGEARWVFGAGAVVGSVLWFTALGLGSRRLAPLLRSRRAWRILDAGIALVMIGLAVSLVAAA